MNDWSTAHVYNSKVSHESESSFHPQLGLSRILEANPGGIKWKHYGLSGQNARCGMLALTHTLKCRAPVPIVVRWAWDNDLNNDL